MARKLFYATFVIDEESYSPEPGPVDQHFVCHDLSQSRFGVQPGVSDVVVWNTIEELIAEHRERESNTIADPNDGSTTAPVPVAHVPETCPSMHWNRGDDICADCGADLNPAPVETQPNAMLPPPPVCFRDHLSPVMRDALAFEYYEVRPCIERNRQIASYADEGDYAEDLVAAQNSGQEFRTFWSLYGVDAGVHTTIGDFISKDAAHDVMNAILAVPAAARNVINAGRPVRGADRSGIGSVAGHAADWLDDMINQSSNAQRI